MLVPYYAKSYNLVSLSEDGRTDTNESGSMLQCNMVVTAHTY